MKEGDRPLLPDISIRRQNGWIEALAGVLSGIRILRQLRTWLFDVKTKRALRIESIQCRFFLRESCCLPCFPSPLRNLSGSCRLHRGFSGGGSPSVGGGRFQRRRKEGYRASGRS